MGLSAPLYINKQRGEGYAVSLPLIALKKKRKLLPLRDDLGSTV